MMHGRKNIKCKINPQLYHITLYCLPSLSLFLVKCCFEQKLKDVVVAVVVFVFVVSFRIKI